MLWLLSRSEYDKAEVVLSRIARRNLKISRSEANLVAIDVKEAVILSDTRPDRRNTETDSVRGIFSAIRHHPTMRAKILLLSLTWLSIGIVMTGLQVNSVNFQALNPYYSFIALAAMEYPGNVLSLLFVDKCGRKISTVLFIIIAAGFNLASSFTLQSGLVLVFASIGRCRKKENVYLHPPSFNVSLWIPSEHPLSVKLCSVVQVLLFFRNNAESFEKRIFY